MATTNELFCVYVNEDATPKTLSTVRVLADNCDPISDKRPTIMIKMRRPNGQGGYFTDEVSGWPAFAIHRYRGKPGAPIDGVTVTRCRPKDGPSAAEGRDLYFDDDATPGKQKVWPTGLNQATMGGSGPRLIGYDTSASDYDDLLAEAQAMDPDNTPLTT